MINNVFRVIGIRRSGNHAIINWLCGLYDPNYTKFINDINPQFGKFRINYFRNNISPNSMIPCLKNTELKKAVNIIFSHENRNLYNVNYFIDEQSFSKHNFHTIIVMRDFFNMMASQFMAHEKLKWLFKVNDSEYVKREVTFWKQYANEFIGNTDILRFNFGTVIKINYNDWVINKEYRKSIASKCSGAIFSDRCLNGISPWGYGSSFENNKKLVNKLKNNEYDRRKFLTRYKQCLHIPEYRKLFEDRELVELSYKIFGIDYDLSYKN